MTRLLVCCLVVVGCTSEYERTYGETEAEYEARMSSCSDRLAADEHVLTLVDSERWQVGELPFWSTPEEVRAALGPPDSTLPDDIPVEFGPDLYDLVYESAGEGSGGRVVVTVVNDSLAYVPRADLGAGPLSTDRGRFGLGAAVAEIREAFPESYECRDMAVFDGLYHDQFYPVLVVADTARGARLVLLFKDGGLLSVRTNYYMLDLVHGTMP